MIITKTREGSGSILSEQELDLDKVVKIFEESWRELSEGYSDARIVSSFCSEADVELILAHKLLDKLPAETVHIEFPVPFDVERLSNELWYFGRVKMRGCFKPDIAIIDPIELRPYLFVELKFTPIYWSYLPLYHGTRTPLSKEAREELKERLERTINYLRRVRKEEPTQQDIEKTYFGIDKQGRTNVEKLIGIINELEKKKKETVAGYLCVVDEIYPNIEKILQKAIKKYNPPSQFKILAKHSGVYESLVKALENL